MVKQDSHQQNDDKNETTKNDDQPANNYSSTNEM
jgi:hypothetical protein